MTDNRQTTDRYIDHATEKCVGIGLLLPEKVDVSKLIVVLYSGPLSNLENFFMLASVAITKDAVMFPACRACHIACYGKTFERLHKT